MILSVLCSSFRLTRRAENGTRTRAARERFRETLQTPPAPGRGALRSQVPSPLIRRHTKRGKNLSVSSLFWSGKRDSDPRPQPWQGCALPTELFPHRFPPPGASREACYPCFGIANISAFFDSAKFSRKKHVFFIPTAVLPHKKRSGTEPFRTFAGLTLSIGRINGP